MIWILLAVTVCLTDLCIKRYIDRHKTLHSREKIAGGHIVITKCHNPGAMLGLMKKKPRLLLGVTLCCVGGIAAAFLGSLYKKKSPLVQAGLALLLGGAASNAYDRVMQHQVTDYFSLHIGIPKLEKLIFNLGDFAIFFGTLLAIIGEFTE